MGIFILAVHIHCTEVHYIMKQNHGSILFRAYPIIAWSCNLCYISSGSSCSNRLLIGSTNRTFVHHILKCVHQLHSHTIPEKQINTDRVLTMHIGKNVYVVHVYIQFRLYSRGHIKYWFNIIKLY